MKEKQRKSDQDIEKIVRDVVEEHFSHQEEPDQQEYYGPVRVIDVNNIPSHQERLFDFDFEAYKAKADKIKKLNERLSFWKDCLKKMQRSKDYYIYKGFQGFGWPKTPINKGQNPLRMLKSLRIFYRTFDNPQPGEANDRFYQYIGVLLHGYLNACISDFEEKVKSEIKMAAHR